MPTGASSQAMSPPASPPPNANAAPNTTEVVGHAPEATVQQANDAAAAAKEALRTWRNVPMEERCALLGRTAEILSRRIGELVPLLSPSPSACEVAETWRSIEPACCSKRAAR